METAAEDDEIAERMDAGRKALYAQGRSEVGPYQSPMEDGMQHFHEFYRRHDGSAHRAPVTQAPPMLRTLISTDDLETRLAQPDIVICDVRHDLTKPDTWGREQYAAGHIPGAVFVHLDTRPFRAEDRHQRPPSVAHARAGRRDVRPPRHREGQAGRGVRPGRRRVCRASVVDAALARLRIGRRARRRLREMVRGRPRRQHGCRPSPRPRRSISRA